MKIAALIVGIVLVLGLLALGVWAYTPDKSRSELEAKYKVDAKDYIDLPGVRLRFKDSGPRGAPTIVLLHGFGSSLETWDDWAASLARDFRVLRFDWPGMGLSGLDSDNDYSDARSVAVLKAFLDKLEIARASVAGNSMGGKLAWMFADRYPANVDKLILISPDGFASAGFEYDKAAEVPFAVSLLPYVLPPSLVRMSLSPAYGDPTRLTDALVDRYRDLMLAPGVRDAMVARMKQVVLNHPEGRLRHIQAPTLILWGEKDGMIPFAGAADYAHLIPNARLHALPGLGHVPQEEAAAQSLEQMRAFLLGP